jgi:hypothetical protein
VQGFIDQFRVADQHHVAAGIQVRVHARAARRRRCEAAMPMSSENTTPRKPSSPRRMSWIQRGE